MDIINDIILKFNDFLWTYILIALLLVLGAYFTIRTNFVQFRYLKEMFRLLGDGFSNKKEDEVNTDNNQNNNENNQTDTTPSILDRLIS